MALRATVITVSDEVAAGTDVNRAGPLALDLLAAHDVSATLVVVPDDASAVVAAIRTAITGGSRVVITSGGTGIGPGDITADAVTPLLGYQLPGIAEEIRRRGAAQVASALVSRVVAGVVPGRLPAFVLAAPGSRGGVTDAIAVAGPLLVHIIEQLDGAGHS